MHEKDPATMRMVIDSARRISLDQVQVSRALDSKEAARSLYTITHPVSLKGAIRTSGVALALAPEPFTTAVGVAMIAGSYLMKSQGPASLADLEGAAVSVLGELSSMTFADLSI